MNIGLFIYNIGEAALGLATKLYEAFNMQVSIKWIQTIINTFGASVELPSTISLSYILSGASAALLLTFIIFRLVK